MWDPNWKYRDDWSQLYRFLRLFLPDTEAMTVASAESYDWGARLYGGFSYVKSAVEDIQRAFRAFRERLRLDDSDSGSDTSERTLIQARYFY